MKHFSRLTFVPYGIWSDCFIPQEKHSAFKIKLFFEIQNVGISSVLTDLVTNKDFPRHYMPM